jgi:HlyD family secretion protein
MRTIRPRSLTRTSLYLSGLLIAAALFASSRVRSSVYEVWKPYAGASSETVLAAKIEPAFQVSLFTEYTAHVTQVLVSAGARVAKGDVLAILENGEIASQLTAAERRVEIATARLRETRSKEGLQQTRRLEQERLLAARRDRDAAKERMDGFSLAGAEGTLETARSRVSGLRGLVRQGLATRVELDSAQAAEDAAQRDFASAREHVSRLRQEFESASSHVRQLDLQNSAPRSSIVLAESDLEDARATLNTAAQRADRLRVTAPAAGTVTDLPVRAGEWIPAGAPVARVADLAQLRISAPVTAVVAQKVSAGERVRVCIPTEPPQRLDAFVDSVTLAPDAAQHAYLIRVIVPNPSQQAVLVGLEAAIEFFHSKRL